MPRKRSFFASRRSFCCSRSWSCSSCRSRSTFAALFPNIHWALSGIKSANGYYQPYPSTCAGNPRSCPGGERTGAARVPIVQIRRHTGEEAGPPSIPITHQRKLMDNDLCFAVDKNFIHFIAQLLARLDRWDWIEIDGIGQRQCWTDDNEVNNNQPGWGKW